MTQDHATPVPRRVLVAVPGSGPAPVPPVPGGSTEGGTAPVPVPPVQGVPMTVPERAGTAVRHYAGLVSDAAHELWLHPERPVHALWHGKPGSFAEHFSYVASRAWVPEELTGKKAGFIAWAGFAYHVLIAWPLKTAAKVIDAAADRPLRLACLIVFIIALYLFLPI